MFRASRMAGSVGAALAAVAVLAGCGGKDKGPLDKVVARAGDIQVTLADFADAWNKISPPNRPDISTIEQKRTFANDLVNQRILLAEARRLGGITDPRILDALEQRRRTDMLSALYRAEVTQKVEVMGSEVEELYQKRGTAVKASHILLDDMETARKLHADITAGRIAFDEAAKQYSLDQSTKVKGGSLGEIQWAQTLPTFQDRAFSQEPGTISEPFETTFGVHILRVEERVPRQLGTLDEMRVQLRNEVRSQKEQLRLREFSAELEKKAGLAWNEDGLAALEAAIARMTEVDPDTVDADRRFLPDVSEAEKGTVLATFSGRSWTIGDYVTALEKQPYSSRPPARIPRAGLRELIRSTQIAPELAAAEAQARGLGDTPELKSTVARLEEQVLIEQLHGRFMQSVDVTPEDVRAYFDSTRAADSSAFMYPERVDMLVITNPSVDVVKDALRRMRKGENEQAVLKEVSFDHLTNQKGGRTGLVGRGTYSPPIEDVAFSGRVGKGWSEPVVLEGAAAAVKVLDQQPPRPARFEEIEGQLTQALQQQRGDEAFEDWLDKERETRGVEILDDALALYDQAVGAQTAPPAPAANPSQGG